MNARMALSGSSIVTAMKYASPSMSAPRTAANQLAFGGFSPEFSERRSSTGFEKNTCRRTLRKISRKITANTISEAAAAGPLTEN